MEQIVVAGYVKRHLLSRTPSGRLTTSATCWMPSTAFNAHTDDVHVAGFPGNEWLQDDGALVVNDGVGFEYLCAA